MEQVRTFQARGTSRTSDVLNRAHDAACRRRCPALPGSLSVQRRTAGAASGPWG